MASRPDDQSVRYDVDEAFQLSATYELIVAPAAPDLSEIAAQQSVGVVATYFDTVDGRLAAAAIEIRQEVGSEDAGWHVSIRLPDGVHEQRAALGRSERTVPIQFRRLIWIASRGAALQPVGTLSIDREIRQFGRDDTVLVEIGLDRVTGRRLSATPETDSEPPPVVAHWSELTLRPDGSDQLEGKRIDRQLRRFGAARSTARPALAAWLAAAGEDEKGSDRKAARKASKAAVRQRFSGLSPAGSVVVRYLAEELDSLLRQDIPVRLDRPDSLHQMRVATRRLRSGMQTFRVLFEAEATDPLAAELKWLAGELGRARDAEVLRARLLDAVSLEHSHERADTATVRAVERETRQSQRSAFAAVVAALDSERYRLLVSGLESLVADPPLTERAARPARKQLRRMVSQAYLDVSRKLADAAEATTGSERDKQLHAARKAAKRARYAAEAVRPAFGKEAKSFAVAMERLQDALGDYNDSVVMQERLHELALAGTPAAAFALGRLHAAQTEHQVEIAARIDRAAGAADKKSLRDWLP
jgi:CHAD domain-containing protein